MEINCATLPVHLMESELFGYKQGAFTGAWRDKPGKFQLAEEGTILLDEISEMSPYMQAKLLQVLQEGEFSAVGGMENVKVNVRIIAASNSNLKKLIDDGTFRSDLYYRLAVITMRLPSLKERKEDILPLANYFMDKYSNVYHKQGLRITDQLLSLLESYDWPGNVRELENIIKSFVALENESMVSELLQKRIESREPQSIQEIALPQRFDMESDFSLRKLSDKAAEKAERKLIQRAVQETNGNKKRAARLLGVSYKCMLNKIKEYGM
jgi:two-component system response regulator AtoC